MKKDNYWMLMTYYCPTHGDSGRVEVIEMNSKEIIKTHFKKSNNSKNIENSN